MNSGQFPSLRMPASRCGHLAQPGLASPPVRSCPAQRRRLEVHAGFKLGSSNSNSTSAASRQQQTAMVAIDPSVNTSSSQREGPSLPIIALAVGALGLVAMAIKKFKSQGMDDNTTRYSVNMYLSNVMKDVNTVRIEDLSSDQIEAARARRSKERANHKLSLEDVDLPQNHPFATKQVLSKEEHEQSLQNLRARSMRRRNYEAMQASAEAAAAAGHGANGRQR